MRWLLVGIFSSVAAEGGLCVEVFNHLVRVHSDEHMPDVCLKKKIKEEEEEKRVIFVVYLCVRFCLFVTYMISSPNLFFRLSRMESLLTLLSMTISSHPLVFFDAIFLCVFLFVCCCCFVSFDFFLFLFYFFDLFPIFGKNN